MEFTDGFESGDLRKWSSCQWTGRNDNCQTYNGTSDYSVTVVPDPDDPTGRPHVARFEVRDGDVPPFGGGERAEIADPVGTETHEGDERWISFDAKFAADFPVPVGWGNVITQWRTLGDDSGSGPVSLGVDGGDGQLHLEQPNGAPEYVTVAAGDIARGTWRHYLLHVKFSTDATVGYFALSIDGTQVVAPTHAETIRPGFNDGDYVKFGIYRDAAATQTAVLYLDNIRIADTPEPPAGSGSGTSGTSAVHTQLGLTTKINNVVVGGGGTPTSYPDPTTVGLPAGTAIPPPATLPDGRRVQRVPGDPYELDWWNYPDDADEIDKLARVTPFDYRESWAWNAAHTRVINTMLLGYPRLGRKRADLRFAQGENILHAVVLRDDPDLYASEVVVRGAGTGKAAVVGHASARDPVRLRRVAVITDQTITSQAAADAEAAAELHRRQNGLTIGELTIDARHPNAPLGSFIVGDDILVHAELPWFGTVALWHRITEYEWDVDAEQAILRLARSESFHYAAPPSTPPADDGHGSPYVALPDPVQPATPPTGGTGTGGTGTGGTGTGGTGTGGTGTGGTGTGGTGTGGTGTGGTGTGGTGTGGTGTGGTGTGGTGTGGSADDGTQAAVVFGWGPVVDGDEFDYTGSPGSKWSMYDGPGHAGNGIRSPSAYTVNGDYCRCHGDAGGTTGGMAFTNGLMYQRWEIRARIAAEPGATGNPYHAVFILWPDSDEWPQGGELDWLEVDVGDARATAFMHHPADTVIQDEYNSDPIDLTVWHNWAFEWGPNALVGYVDGVEWFRDSDGSAQPPGPMHLTYQLDNFFGSGGMQAANMDAMWCRMYAV